LIGTGLLLAIVWTFHYPADFGDVPVPALSATALGHCNVLARSSVLARSAEVFRRGHGS